MVVVRESTSPSRTEGQTILEESLLIGTQIKVHVNPGFA